MHRFNRIIAVVALAGFAGSLSACANFDPEKLDIFGFGDKKKMPGDRKELFPQGVPGVTQGVPPELIKGHQAAAPAGDVTSAPVAPVVAEPEKPKPKPKPKRRVQAQPANPAPARAASRPPAQQQSAWPPGSAPPPAQGAWPAPAQQQDNVTWPAPGSTRQ